MNPLPTRILRAIPSALALLLAAGPAPLRAADWAPGDVFVGLLDGTYQVHSPSGALREVLPDGLGGGCTGCLVARDGTLWGTDWGRNAVVAWDGAHPHPIVRSFPTPGQGLVPDEGNESLVLDLAGDLYVSHSDGEADLHRYTVGGALAQEYDAAVTDRGIDWIDLASDQTTLFYTSEGGTVLRYDLLTATQLPDYADLSAWGPLYGIRILPPGDGSGGVLVAGRGQVLRVDASGTVVATYGITGTNAWFPLALDPDGRSFWVADTGDSLVARFDIASRQLLGSWVPAPSNNPILGLCVAAEPRAADLCGNGLRDPGEDCDDGNRLPGDGCDTDCQAETVVCGPTRPPPEVDRSSLRAFRSGPGGADVALSFDAGCVPARATHLNVHRGRISAFAAPPHYDHGKAPGGCGVAGSSYVDAGAARPGLPGYYYLVVCACAGAPADVEGSYGQALLDGATPERPSAGDLGTAACP